jgi:hypothetical protein
VRKRIAFFFLSGALFLVMGHSILPHNHTNGLCSQCISIAEKPSLSDIIIHSLTQNLGSNHLEEFSNQQKVIFRPIFFGGVDFLFSEALDLEVALFSFSNQIPIATSSEIVSQYYFGDKGLRAPPVQV